MTDIQQALALFALVYWSAFAVIVYVVVQHWRGR